MDNPTDEFLVLASRAGDRLAFADLVRRYRDMVIGVAYNGIGEFNRSEDIAQQTFVTAWKRNLDLKDPARLASWLCGIARNLARNERRRLASCPAKTLDESTVDTSIESPEKSSIAKEESEMLWAVLEKVPETYREPMVLYYREQATTADVAKALDVTEDVVRQRLSRGRKLLEEKVAEFVETRLATRKASPNFVASVLVALPGATLPKASGVMAMIGVKMFYGLGYLLGPLIGLAGAIYGSKCSLDSATSERERRFLWKMIAAVSLLVVALLTVLLGIRMWLPNMFGNPWVQGSIWGIYLSLLVTAIVLGNRRIARIKLEQGNAEERAGLRRIAFQPASPRSAAWNLVGALGGSVSWMFIVAALQRDWIGFLLAAGLLSTSIAVFVPKVIAATTARRQLSVNFQAVILIILGMSGIVALRWSVWSELIW